VAISRGLHFSVGAPAFMRGEERFSAPEKVRLQSMRFSAGIVEIPGLGIERLSRWTKVQLPPAEAGGSHQKSLTAFFAACVGGMSNLVSGLLSTQGSPARYDASVSLLANASAG